VLSCFSICNLGSVALDVGQQLAAVVEVSVLFLFYFFVFNDLFVFRFFFLVLASTRCWRSLSLKFMGAAKCPDRRRGKLDGPSFAVCQPV